MEKKKCAAGRKLLGPVGIVLALGIILSGCGKTGEKENFFTYEHQVENSGEQEGQLPDVENKKPNGEKPGGNITPGESTPTPNPTPFGPVDRTGELNRKLLVYMLSRIGCGYKFGGGHFEDFGDEDIGMYDCSGLLEIAFREQGYRNVPDDTNAWFTYMRDNDVQVGDVVSFVSDDETTCIRYQLVAKEERSLDIEDLLTVPGTILVKISPGKDHGHLTIVLGKFELQETVEATVNYVAAQVAAEYGEEVLSCYGKDLNKYLTGEKNKEYNIYGHANVWDYRSHNNRAYADFPYHSVWQLDSLDEGYGVTVNNNACGQAKQFHIMFALQPVW